MNKIKQPIPYITSRNVSKYFYDQHHKPVTACENIDLTVHKHEFVCIVGPSGCGKSTFLRMVAGLMQPDHGTIDIADDLKQAMIFQNAALFPWLSVWDNIAFGLTMKGASNKVIEKAVQAQLKNMDLVRDAHQHPKELSGGMKQRVGIARALAIEPDILLLDEPFSALDAFTAERLRQDILRIWEAEKRTMLMVTHLVEEAVEMADRIIVMTKRPGQIKAVVEVDLPRPRNLRSPAFYKLVDRVRDLVVTEHVF